MAVLKCLAQTGFSREEMKAILEDIGDGDAADVVRQHIAALEAERADIIRQATPAAPPEPKATAKDSKLEPPMLAEQERQLLDQHPDLMIPGEDGQPVRVADLLDRVNADIEAAKRDASLYDVAVACFLGTGGP